MLSKVWDEITYPYPNYLSIDKQPLKFDNG